MTPDPNALVRDILEPAGVSPGSNLIVHSSFRGLSHAGVRAETFIESLLEYVDGGTLMMPAMSWRIVNAENPVFDELNTPSHVGVLTEVFRTNYATHRSVHPTHSIAAHGPLAEPLTDKHHLYTTPCPPECGFGQLRHIDAHILLLGVGLVSCTAIHCVEELVAPDFYVLPEIEHYTGIDRHGNEIPLRIRRHRRLDRDFDKFEPEFLAQGKLTAGEAAGTRWLSIRADVLHEALMQTLTACPHGTLSDAALAAERGTADV